MNVKIKRVILFLNIIKAFILSEALSKFIFIFITFDRLFFIPI